MKVYLDACCLNRPFDDQSQFRIRLETEAVLLVLEKFYRREWKWIGSDALLSEIRRNPDVENRQRALALLSNTHETVRLTEEILQRAEKFEQAGMGAFDAIHLASAEYAGADVLLTTDDRLIKTCKRSVLAALRVENPARWLEEILDES